MTKENYKDMIDELLKVRDIVIKYDFTKTSQIMADVDASGLTTRTNIGLNSEEIMDLKNIKISNAKLDEDPSNKNVLILSDTNNPLTKISFSNRSASVMELRGTLLKKLLSEAQKENTDPELSVFDAINAKSKTFGYNNELRDIRIVLNDPFIFKLTPNETKAANLVARFVADAVNNNNDITFTEKDIDVLYLSQLNIVEALAKLENTLPQLDDESKTQCKAFCDSINNSINNYLDDHNNSGKKITLPELKTNFRNSVEDFKNSNIAKYDDNSLKSIFTNIVFSVLSFLNLKIDAVSNAKTSMDTKQAMSELSEKISPKL